MGRDKENAIQMEGVGGRMGDRQVSIVNWVEGAAEEGESTSAQSSPN